MKAFCKNGGVTLARLELLSTITLSANLYLSISVVGFRLGICDSALLLRSSPSQNLLKLPTSFFVPRSTLGSFDALLGLRAIYLICPSAPWCHLLNTVGDSSLKSSTREPGVILTAPYILSPYPIMTYLKALETSRLGFLQMQSTELRGGWMRSLVKAHHVRLLGILVLVSSRQSSQITLQPS